MRINRIVIMLILSTIVISYLLQPAKQLPFAQYCTVNLGSPFGYHSFMAENLDSTADALDTSPWLCHSTISISIQPAPNNTNDAVHQASACKPQWLLHLLAAHVLLCSPLALCQLDPYDWSFPFVSHLNGLTASFLAFLSGHPVVPCLPSHRCGHGL